MKSTDELLLSIERFQKEQTSRVPGFQRDLRSIEAKIIRHVEILARRSDPERFALNDNSTPEWEHEEDDDKVFLFDFGRFCNPNMMVQS